MFRYSYIIGIIIMLVSGCGETGINHPYISFDTPFPKRFKNLTSIIGNEVTLASETDTQTIHIYFDPVTRLNVITKLKTGDTLTQCWVSKFRQLYYFTEQLNDTAYHIYAVSITKDAIKGLHSRWSQMFDLQNEIDVGNFSHLVKYQDTAHRITRLTFDKHVLKKFYSKNINNYTALSIIHTDKHIQEDIPKRVDTLLAASSENAQELETSIVANVYPNPAKDRAIIILNEDGPYSVTLYDNKGQAISFYQTGPEQEQFILPLDNSKPGMHIIKVEQNNTGKRVFIKLLVTQ